jgi:hypothetical protein
MNRLTLLIRIILLVAVTGMIGAAMAQTAPAPAPAAKSESGLTSYVEFDGTADGDGQAYVLNSSVGYNFNQHFGVDLGVPVYFVRASATSTTGAFSTNGIGNPYLDLRLKFLSPAVNFGSKLTGFVPVGDSRKGLSTGRGAFDWTNRFEHAFERLTPFAEVGIANTITDSRLFIRPYTTLGFNSHFRAGADYDLWKFISVGASAYDILPAGQQTVFSRIVPGSGNTANGSHGRVFQDNQQTTGSADIARDNGFSAWIDASPGHLVDMELGYTRSVHYDLNAVSFSVGFNLARLYRKDSQ